MRKLIGIAAFLFLVACTVWAYAQSFPGQFTCPVNQLMNAIGATGSPTCRALTSADLTGTNAVTASANTAFTGNNTFAGTSVFNNTATFNSPATFNGEVIGTAPGAGGNANVVAQSNASLAAVGWAWTPGGVNQKNWDCYANSSTRFACGAVNDANNARNDWIAVSRGAGTALNSVTITPNTYIGGGTPWVDVRSGANSCAVAAGNGSTDDTSAIQCQINFMQSTFAGGVVYLPCGTYKVTSPIFVSKSYILLVGAGFCTAITSAGVDLTVVGYGSTSAQMHWAGLRDMQLICNQTSGAAHDCLEVDNCVNCTFQDFQVWGGNHALFICGSTNCNVANPAVGGGGDSVFINAFISGWGSAGGNIFEYNSGNWFFNIKADGTGQTTATAININTDASSPSSVQESSFHRVDMSGSFSNASLAINDGGSARSTVVIFHPVISSGYNLGTFRHLSILGGELGTGTFNILSGNLAIAGSMADSGGGGAITFTNTAGTRSCAANIGVTC